MVKIKTAPKKPSEFSNYVITKKSNNNLNELPVFTKDGKSLIVPSGMSCHLYSVATGDHIEELFTCNSNITNIQLLPCDKSILIASTEQGEITIFNINTSRIEKTIQLKLDATTLMKQFVPKFNINKRIVSWEDCTEKYDWTKEDLSKDNVIFINIIVDPGEKVAQGLLWASWYVLDEHQAHISAFFLKTGEHVRNIYNSQLHKVALTKSKMNFSIGVNVLVCMGTIYVFAAVSSSPDKWFTKGRKHMMGHNIEVKCLAVHPSQCAFATGDTLGRVTIWKNITQDRPLKDIYHWHSLPVESIVFSDFGSYLFSGGFESVLVAWALESLKKTFLPRLSAPINNLAIGPDSRYLAVSTIDSKILIIDTNMNPISTVQHFSMWSALEGCPSSIFALDPKTSALVIRGKTGHLQFLSHRDGGRFLFTLDVTNTNLLTREQESFISNLEVTHAEFSRSGNWLVTVERRDDKQAPECRLKFWQFDDLKQSFILNTDIDMPHEGDFVHALDVSDELAVTTGPDGKWKLWSIVESHYLEKVMLRWAACDSGTFGHLLPRPVHFSVDGSVLAVGFGPILTIWDTDTGLLKCNLKQVFRNEELKFVKLGSKIASHLAIAASASTITSWNLVTLCALWTVQLHLELLVSDPASAYMCAFTSSNVFLFTPTSEASICRQALTTQCKVTAGRFITTEQKPQVYFLDSEQSLFCLEDAQDVNIKKKLLNVEVSKKLTPFSAQLAELSRKDVEKGIELKGTLRKLGSEFAASIVESPAYTLPNPRHMCADFLKSLLLVTTPSEDILSARRNQHVDGDIMEVDPQTNESQPSTVSEEVLSKIMSQLFYN